MNTILCLMDRITSLVSSVAPPPPATQKKWWTYNTHSSPLYMIVLPACVSHWYSESWIKLRPLVRILPSVFSYHLSKLRGVVRLIMLLSSFLRRWAHSQCQRKFPSVGSTSGKYYNTRQWKFSFCLCVPNVMGYKKSGSKLNVKALYGRIYYMSPNVIWFWCSCKKLEEDAVKF